MPNKTFLNAIFFSLLLVTVTFNAVAYLIVPSHLLRSVYFFLTIINILMILFILTMNWFFTQFSLQERKKNQLEAQLQEALGEVKQQQEADKIADDLRNELTYEMQELGIHNEKMNLLIELTDMMQACATLQEATKAVAVKCRKILHFSEGTLYIADNTHSNFILASSWGDPSPQQETITLNDCWALRKSAPYQVKNPHANLICSHILEKKILSYMCIPLMAQSSVVGLLHLNFFEENGPSSEEQSILISTIVNTLSLAFANIQLRETLRNQSTHDSLTGLYNRRYLDEIFPKELNLAKHSQHPLAVLLLDIDHFKLFNDTHGHEAGDLVLQEFGKFFRNEFRLSDMVCRYGGEEFLCLLINCPLEHAINVAEDLRIKISNLSVIIDSKILNHFTISLGISIFPEDGTTMNELIEAADKALYRAKETDRNKIVVYSDMKKGHSYDASMAKIPGK